MSVVVDALAPQARLGDRQQAVEHELRGRDLLAVEPGEVRAQALARRGVEVRAGLVEVDAGR